MPAALIPAAVGVGLPIAANALGIGKNDTRAKTFNETSAYDPNAFQYGGKAGVADQTADRFQQLAIAAQNRNAPQAQNVAVNYGGANSWLGRVSGDRANQSTAADLMMRRAQGQVPSIAGQQAAIDMQRAAAAQSSAAASARGAAGLALAGQAAANNTATAQTAISNNAQINAANERLAAEQGAFGAYSGIRAGDTQQQQIATQQAQYNAQLGAQQNQFNAQQQAQRNAQNDAYSLGLYNQEAGVRQQQLYGGMTGQQMLNQSTMNATNRNVEISQNNANREYDYDRQAVSAGQSGLSGATQLGGGAAPPPAAGGGGATPPLEQFRADGGPVAPGRPYIVGERGPELIVPSRAGMVYPAEHPASRMAVLSDDRMKMGMSPLGLLGVFGGSSAGPQNPVSGPVGSGGGMAPSSYEVLSNGGENVAASGDAMSRVATQYATDPTGGMQSGGLLSDERAKRHAFELGAAYAARRLTGEEMQPWTDDPDPEVSGQDEQDQPVGPTATYMNFSPPGPHSLPDVAPRSPHSLPSPPAGLGGSRAARGMASEPLDLGAMMADKQLGGRGRPEPMAASGDPVTAQFAQGLAPIRFEYKPGMGPGGQQTGVRAQAAAAQPVTSSMVTKRPDGLLQIDPQMGLGTALAGVGNASQKQLVLEQRQNEQEQKLNGLLAIAARREGY